MYTHTHTHIMPSSNEMHATKGADTDNKKITYDNFLKVSEIQHDLRTVCLLLRPTFTDQPIKMRYEIYVTWCKNIKLLTLSSNLFLFHCFHFSSAHLKPPTSLFHTSCFWLPDWHLQGRSFSSDNGVLNKNEFENHSLFIQIRDYENANCHANISQLTFFASARVIKYKFVSF